MRTPTARRAVPRLGYWATTIRGSPPHELLSRAKAIATTAGGAGFGALWVTDEIPPSNTHGEGPGFEAYSMLGALAAQDGSLLLGAIPAGDDGRHPSIVAKLVTAVDVISRGRGMVTLRSDIGVSRPSAERRAPGTNCRSEGPGEDRLTEALRVCRAVLDDEEPIVGGRRFHVDGALNRPRPVAPGGVPLTVVAPGGAPPTPAEAGAVARYADALMVTGDAAAVRASVDALGSAAEEALRPAPPAVLWIDRRAGHGSTGSSDRHRRTVEVPRYPEHVAEAVADRVEAGAVGCVVSAGGLGREEGTLSKNAANLGPGGSMTDAITRLGHLLAPIVGSGGL